MIIVENCLKGSVSIRTHSHLSQIIYDHVVRYDLKEGARMNSGKRMRRGGIYTGKGQLEAVAGSVVEKGMLFFDIELAHASAQGAAIKTKDFGRTVFAAYFPLRLFQYLEDMLLLYCLQ